MYINFDVFNKDKKYINNVKIIYFLCILSVFIAFNIWFIIYSEPYKIFRIEKIYPIQYTLG